MFLVVVMTVFVWVCIVIGFANSVHLVEGMSVGGMIDRLDKYKSFGKEYDEVLEGLQKERTYEKVIRIQIDGYNEVRNEIEKEEEKLKEFWERRGVKVNIDDSTYDIDGVYEIAFIKTSEYLGGDLLLLNQKE